MKQRGSAKRLGFASVLAMVQVCRHLMRPLWWIQGRFTPGFTVLSSVWCSSVLPACWFSPSISVCERESKRHSVCERVGIVFTV